MYGIEVEWKFVESGIRENIIRCIWHFLEIYFSFKNSRYKFDNWRRPCMGNLQMSETDLSKVCLKYFGKTNCTLTLMERTWESLYT
jgi:hypothetical protein